nr:cilia- and flagella-associated protein 73 isoform X4 [Anser cygnoides]
MSPGLEESLRRVFQEKLQLRTVPAWDSASLLPSSTRLLLKRREVAEVERALQAQREHPWAPQEFWQRMEGLDQRRQQLGQREEQLRDVALRFDAFLKVSAARRERALGRAGEERARAAQRGAEADGLQQELAGLLRRREQLRRRLRGLRVFGNYLRGVVATTGQVRVPVPCPQGVVFLQGHQHPLHPKLHVGASVGGSGGAGTQNRLRDEGEQHLGGVGAPATARPLPTTQFQDVPSMLAHFGALAGVRAALLHQLEAGQQRLAQGRARLQRYHEEAGGELLRGRDEVVQLRARLEAVRHDVLQGVRAAVGPLGPPPGGEGLAYRPLIVTPLVWRADAPWGGDGEGAQGQECWEVQGTWGPGLSVCLSVCPPGVLLDPDPERGHPQDPAAGADQDGSAEPLPARHQAPESPQGRGPGGHRDPAGRGAALHAGPGCHLC